MHQIERLIWLDKYLFNCQKNPQSRPSIQRVFNGACEEGDEMSYSTLVRDMTLLEQCGAEVRHDGEGWYSTAMAFRCNQKRK